MLGGIMKKLHITTQVNFGYKPKDTGLNIANDNTYLYPSEWEAGRGCDYETDQQTQYYLPGIVIKFANYTGIMLADGKHITLHYGDDITLPDGLFFGMPVLICILGKSTSKAGECLLVEVRIPGHATITEQI